jgi:hypothetical protein
LPGHECLHDLKCLDPLLAESLAVKDLCAAVEVFVWKEGLHQTVTT